MPTTQATACHVHFGTLTPGVTVQIILLDSQGPHLSPPNKAHGQVGQSPQAVLTRLDRAIRAVQTPEALLGDGLGGSYWVRLVWFGFFAAADVHFMCFIPVVK